MPPIKTAEEAILRAETFVRKYHPVLVLEQAYKEENSWLIVFDVSIFPPKKIVRIRLNAADGTVLEYLMGEV